MKVQTTKKTAESRVERSETMKLADQLRNHATVIEQQRNAIEAAKRATIMAKWDTAIKLATGPEMRQKILNEVEKYHGKSLDNFSFVVMDSRNIPNRKGGDCYDIPLNGGGNLFCAVRDGKVSQTTLYEWYPPFETVRDFYIKEGFYVQIVGSYDGGGMEDWLSLAISLLPLD